jgi:prepilin-type N-terminal cleavage/methylation domain-containing protein
MKTKLKQRGFTLIELLVVITIIAILASVSVPVFSSIQRKAKLNKSLQHAKQIALALRVYAGDEGGLYPPGQSANEAFADLIDEIGTEKIFYVPGCRWHGDSNSKTARGPDNLWEDSEPQGEALAPGENHYAYAVGFNDATSARFPLIASGFSNSPGQYIDDPTKVGGVWEGKNCVVIYCDGSGENPKLKSKDDYKLIEDKGGQKIDVLNQEEVEWVNPEQG